MWDAAQGEVGGWGVSVDVGHNTGGVREDKEYSSVWDMVEEHKDEEHWLVRDMVQEKHWLV